MPHFLTTCFPEIFNPVKKNRHICIRCGGIPSAEVAIFLAVFFLSDFLPTTEVRTADLSDWVCMLLNHHSNLRRNPHTHSRNPPKNDLEIFSFYTYKERLSSERSSDITFSVICEQLDLSIHHVFLLNCF